MVVLCSKLIRMTHTYTISGMTCGGCVAKVRSELLKLGDVTSAKVQLNSPQATIEMQKHISTTTLQDVISKAGNYTIAEDGGGMHPPSPGEEKTTWFATYKPILVIGAYILGITLVVETTAGHFKVDRWMRHFMAAFFLTFSFFKMLDLKGFAESYSTYDIVAKKWSSWGYVYAFIELALGIAYFLNFNALITNITTLVIMSLSIVGVLQSVLNQRKIRCACLGSVFNLPMSTITIIEDGLMIAMSLVMLIGLA